MSGTGPWRSWASVGAPSAWAWSWPPLACGLSHHPPVLRASKLPRPLAAAHMVQQGLGRGLDAPLSQCPEAVTSVRGLGLWTCLHHSWVGVRDGGRQLSGTRGLVRRYCQPAAGLSCGRVGGGGTCLMLPLELLASCLVVRPVLGSRAPRAWAPLVPSRRSMLAGVHRRGGVLTCV